MRSMLEHERWQFHLLLPESWMVKDSSAFGAAKSSKEYLAWDATLLRSYKVALEFLRTSSATSEDIASFEEFAADESRKLRVQVFGWREDDPCLPEGWRYKAAVGSGSGRWTGSRGWAGGSNGSSPWTASSSPTGAPASSTW
jgi:hypothetical protein